MFNILLLGLAVASSGGSCLDLLSYSPINVEGTGTTASTVLQLRNPNDGDVNYTLTVTDFKNLNTAADSRVVPIFSGADGKPAGTFLVEKALAKSNSFPRKIDFTHLLEAGESTAGLLCNGNVIGTLESYKLSGIPFKISIEGAPTDAAGKSELSFIRGQERVIYLKNDDPMTYPVVWELAFKEATVSDKATLPPNSVTTITVQPKASWFSAYESFFKDEAVDGRLIVRYSGVGGRSKEEWPSKSLPVKGRLSFHSYGWRSVIDVAVILLLLALGGFVSSFINVDLVNRLRMIALKRRLARLGKTLGEIAPQLGSQIRVTLLLERKRIIASLPEVQLFTPETGGALQQIGNETDSLEGRLNLAVQISEARSRQSRALNNEDPPSSLMEHVDDSVTEAEALLGRSILTSAEIQKAQSAIGNAFGILDGLNKPDPDLEQTLTNNLQDLRARFTDAILASPICQTIKGAVPIPFGLLTERGAGFGSQSERDSKIRRLQIIWDLIQMGKPDPETIENLKPQSISALRLAELRLCELKDGITLDDFVATIKSDPAKLRIQIDRVEVRKYQGVLMRIVFNDPRYARAAAKKTISCKWNFGHGDFMENGWEIHHYFPTAGIHTVSVTFEDQEKNEITGGPPIELKVNVQATVDPGYSQTIAELQRWAAGFFVAVVTLFAVAKDKIVLLDTVTAVFAVFLIGFTIDVAKNVLAPK